MTFEVGLHDSQTNLSRVLGQISNGYVGAHPGHFEILLMSHVLDSAIYLARCMLIRRHEPRSGESIFLESHTLRSHRILLALSGCLPVKQVEAIHWVAEVRGFRAETNMQFV
jgi:hypothetical protein